MPGKDFGWSLNVEKMLNLQSRSSILFALNVDILEGEEQWIRGRKKGNIGK